MLVTELQPDLDRATTGAKAANLGRLLEMDASVAPGFVLTRQALDLFLNEAGLLAQIQDFIAHAQDTPPQQRTTAFHQLQAQLATTPIPPALGVSRKISTPHQVGVGSMWTNHLGKAGHRTHRRSNAAIALWV
nr:hypothetical protein [Candidatus Latescibacterota bacterium]